MDFSRIQDFDMQLLHVFNGSEKVWLDQMAMALTSGWTWSPLYVVLFVVVIRNNEMCIRDSVYTLLYNKNEIFKIYIGFCPDGAGLGEGGSAERSQLHPPGKPRLS